MSSSTQTVSFRGAPPTPAHARFVSQVRQIMKKWADLKCDGKRRLALLRAPNGTAGRRKRKSLDSVEKMVHGILLMSPTGGQALAPLNGNKKKTASSLPRKYSCPKSRNADGYK